MTRLRPRDGLVERVNDGHPPLAALFQDMPVQAQSQPRLDIE